MSGETAPPPTPPLPVAFLLAAATPTVLVAGLEVAGALGGAAPPARQTLALFWAFTTLPLVMLVLGLRHAMAHGTTLIDPQVKQILRSLAKTEQVATEAVQTLARLQAHGPPAVAAPAASATPGDTALPPPQA
ncbi:MAG: hypothetical protein ABR586_01955 [Thermoplasmatota archaeon]